MTVGRARAVLSILWIVLTCPLILLISIQTVVGYYGDDWDLPWSWLMSLIFPTLSLVVAVWTVSTASVMEKPVRSMHVFWGAVTISLFYLINLYIAVIVPNYSHFAIEKALKASAWYLVPLQGLVTVSLGKLFVENIE